MDDHTHGLARDIGTGRCSDTRVIMVLKLTYGTHPVHQSVDC
jgi:hypothetical protein